MILPACPKCKSELTMDIGVHEPDVTEAITEPLPVLIDMQCLWCHHKWIAEYDQSWRRDEIDDSDLIPF